MDAKTQVSGQRITLNVVDVQGRAMEGIKFLGLLTEAAYGNDDFNLYVRWDVDYGVVRVDRSDTDEALVTVGLARKGKLEAFQDLMRMLANRYGTPVRVEADPGIRVSAMMAKMIGTYLPSDYTARDLAPSTLVVGPGPVSAKSAKPRPAVAEILTVKSCSTAGCKTGQTPVMLLKVATGPSAKYTNDVYFCGVCWPYYEHSTELGNVVESVSLVDESDIAEARSQAWASAGHPRDDHGKPVIPTVVDPFAMMDSDIVRVVARVDYFSQVLIKDAHLMIDALPEHVDAARKAGLLVESGEWLSVPKAASELLTSADRVDAWMYFNPAAIKNGRVITDQDMRDFVTRAITEGGEDIDSHDVAMIVDMLQAEFGTVDLETVPTRRFWDIVEAGNVIRAAESAIPIRHDSPLPIRTPGDTLSAWDMAESEIWAGTDQVVRMRFPRKMKKALRNSLGARRRPIDVKRARVAKGW